MKKLLTLISTLLLMSPTLAQDIPQEDTPTPPACAYYNTIQGPTDIQLQTEKTFGATVEGSGGALIDRDGWSDQSTFRIIYDGNEIDTFTNVSQFTYSFGQAGVYTIIHETTYNDCPISTSTNITTYAHSILYISDSDSVTSDITNNLKQRSILLHATPTIDSDTVIDDHNLIVVDTTNASTPTQKILTTIDAQLPPQSPTPIAVISSASQDLSKKIIGSIMRDSPHPTHIIDNDSFRELMLLWRIGDRDTALSKITSSTQANDQETTFGFNGFVDTLLFQGIPLPVVASMITLVAMTVFLIFARQVVGISVFSIYYPLLGAIALPLIGKKLFITFFVIAWISHWLTYLLSRRLSILVHAKIGVYLTIYSILCITALRATSMSSIAIDRDYTQAIGTRGTIMGFFVIAIIGQKVFQTKKNFRKHITEILTYLAITIPLSRLLTSTTIQYRMITHTWIVFLAIILALLMGRFTGMKLLEYKRFGKLLLKQVKRK